MKVKLRNKEISWLSFNARILQEAADPRLPLLERLRFLGIFSSNLDEFVSVRVATLKRLAKLGAKASKLIGADPKVVLAQINEIIRAQQARYAQVYACVLEELERAGVRFVDETQLTAAQQREVHRYFAQRVRPTLMPIMLEQIDALPPLSGQDVYLVVRLEPQVGAGELRHALIRLPTDILPRFVRLPPDGERECLILLDDVIRYCLGELFSTLRVVATQAYSIKLTRDAELDIDDGVSESYLRKISKSLEKRKLGAPVRLLYDGAMPEASRLLLCKKLSADSNDVDFLAAGRYLNLKDLTSVPDVGAPDLRFPAFSPVPHPVLAQERSLLECIEKQDVLLHYPYHSFDYMIDLLREASIDPQVRSIKITLYRVASRSNVINALVNAVKNGKSVTVILELQARFDEEANVRWADHLQREGVRVLRGLPGLKVHAKLVLITREVGHTVSQYACVSTGNFNEATARFYTDHNLLTADKRITKEVGRVFQLLEGDIRKLSFRHLLVSPHTTRDKLARLIKREIQHAEEGRDAYMLIKLNNLTDPKLIKLIQQAAQKGVDVCLLVRGMFSVVVADDDGGMEIEATGIVDRFLEHSRILAFGNGGEPLCFLASADWMPRNLDHRVEVVCPIYDPAIGAELAHYVALQRADNVKARKLDATLSNAIREMPQAPPVHSQRAIAHWLAERARMKVLPVPVAESAHAALSA